MWSIILIENHKFAWSNEFGWVNGDMEIDVFTEDEKSILNLPDGGIWVKFNSLEKENR